MPLLLKAACLSALNRWLRRRPYFKLQPLSGDPRREMPLVAADECCRIVLSP